MHPHPSTIAIYILIFWWLFCCHPFLPPSQNPNW
jgi:hypothetical protein